MELFNVNGKYRDGSYCSTENTQNIERLKQDIYWYAADTLRIDVAEVNRRIQENIKHEIGKRLNTIV
ncbi:MAG: hypothetical protein MJ237_09555 [bacterium]|nr:hypothetical protein [bacterium]